MIEIKKFKTLFDSEGKPYIIDDDGSIIATSDQIGMVYNEGPPHDHNTHWKDTRYLEDLILDKFISYMDESKGEIYLAVHEVCTNYNGAHIGKDCSCKTGFKILPMMYNNMVIIDLYGILKN